jgi:hypothetical protein
MRPSNGVIDGSNAPLKPGYRKTTTTTTVTSLTSLTGEFLLPLHH